MMALFFLSLIALVVYQYATRKTIGQIYSQFDKTQIRRLTNVPFNVMGWALVFVLLAYSLSALTSLIGELFDVDNYIGLFGGGWLGLILRFLRSYGFIGDIQEPIVLLQYRVIIERVCAVTLLSCGICVAALISFCSQLKKPKLNGTAILTKYYISIACGLTSFLCAMWGLWQFNELINNAVNFHMEEVYWFLSLAFLGTSALGMYWCREVIKSLLSLPQCRTMTWQEVFAKIKINSDNIHKPVEEWHIALITIGFALLVSSFVVLSTLPMSEEQYEEIYEEDEPIAPTPSDGAKADSNADEICMAILRKYYTASYSQIDEWGGEKAFETERFMEYTSCWDCAILTYSQDFDIGDDCLRLESIVPNTKLEHSFIVTVSCGCSGSVPICVVMANIDGVWKIDNIAYEPYEQKYIDYSKPASAYYVYETCGEETPYDESELPFEVPKSEDEEAMPYNASEIIPEESEDFISL